MQFHKSLVKILRFYGGEVFSVKPYPSQHLSKSAEQTLKVLTA